MLFPPRPKGAVPPSELPYYESTKKWLVQPKYNGSRILAHICNQVVEVWNRHGEHHKTYQMPSSVMQEFLSLSGLDKNKEYWLDGELLNKTANLDTKNAIVLFDVLHAGKYLFGVKQIPRLDLLREICGNPTQLEPKHGLALHVTDHIWMAPAFFTDFDKHFKADKGAEVEGLVLREIGSALDNFGQKEYVVSWLIRCRRTNKNVNF